MMVASGSGTAHERSLIEVPADAKVSEFDIAAATAPGSKANRPRPRQRRAGDAPRGRRRGPLHSPNGGEGRTHAAFEIGADADGAEGALAPFRRTAPRAFARMSKPAARNPEGSKLRV